jgi:L-fucose isomerase-like protein
MMLPIKLGFVPSYRSRWTAWTERMRRESLAALAALPSVEVLTPQGAPGEEGYTPHGAVHDLDEAEAVAEFFARHGVDGLVLCPLDFGDERSACKIAERLRLPVLLYATKEPPVPDDDPSLQRVSDSYCGNLSIASGLYRRRLPFHYAGLFDPGEPGLHAELEAFARAVAVVRGLRNARVGQVGVRPCGRLSPPSPSQRTTWSAPPGSSWPSPAFGSARASRRWPCNAGPPSSAPWASRSAPSSAGSRSAACSPPVRPTSWARSPCW